MRAVQQAQFSGRGSRRCRRERQSWATGRTEEGAELYQLQQEELEEKTTQIKAG